MKDSGRYAWCWLLPLFWLVMALSLPLADADSLWYDEVWSLKNAGGALYGPLSPAGIWEQVAFNDPHQAMGYPFVLAAWGALVGWTELAGRYLSLLAGLLAIAMTYRLVREVESKRAGLFAALVLALSAFFLYYTHELRAFTLVALFAALSLWSYRRFVYGAHPALAVQVAFVASGVGLLYSHYFAAATLLGAIGLYHLLFVPKDRRWLQMTGLALLVGLLFLPEVPAFLRGFTRFSPDDVRRTPLTSPEVVVSLGNYVGNVNVLVWAALAGSLFAAWQRPRVRFLLWIAAFGVGATIAANAALGILEPQRLRYVIVLWPVLAGLVGVGLATLSRDSFRWMAVLLAALWVGNALWMHDGAWIDPLRAEDVLRWRTMTSVMREEASPTDLFAYYGGTGQDAYGVRLGFEYSTAELPFPALVTSTLYEGDTGEWAMQQVRNADRVWYGVDRRENLNEYHASFEQTLSKLFITCEQPVQNAEMTLTLYAKDAAFCPADAALARFGTGITLAGAADIQREEEAATVLLRWELAPDVPPQTYNLALHLVAAGAEAPLVQADLPLPTTPVVLTNTVLSLAGLPAGTYELYALVYDWQTGERLTVQGGDRLLLGEVRLPA